MSISIDDYCKNPQLGKNLPEITRTYYNEICLLRRAMDINWQQQLSKLGQGLEHLPESLIQSILSPEGLEMIGIFEGIKLTGKLAQNAMLRAITRGAGFEIREEVAKQVAEKGLMFANSALMSHVLAGAVKEGSIAARAFMFTQLISRTAGYLSSILDIMMILSMILDAWDPAGYGQEMNAESMQSLNDEFNSKFINMYLEESTLGQDEFGRPIYGATWPVEFYADIILADETSNNIDYEKLRLSLQSEYLYNLKVNSNGDPIVWQKGGGYGLPDLISNDKFEQLAKQYSNILGDNNSIVANWIDKYFLIILGILLLFIIILVFIK